ncbi:MAG: hypothetical protein ACP5IA_06385 [Sediminispirochaetaceae bacterium]
MPLEPISEYQTDEYEYVLERRKNEDEVVEELYRDGAEIRRAVYQEKGAYVYGRFYKGEELQRETIEMNERLMEEILYEESGKSTRKYGWKDGNLEYVETITPGGTAIRRKYIRSESGKLLEIIEEEMSPSDSAEASGGGADSARGYGAEAVSGFRYHRGRNGISQWHVDGSGCTHFFYQDLEGKKRITEKYCGGQLTLKRDEFEVEDGTAVTVTRPGDEYVSEALYDTEGNILSRNIQEEVMTISEEYTYQEGLLAKKIVRTGGSVRTTEYSYRRAEGDGAELSVTEEYEDGILSRRTEYSEDGRKEIILYRNGKPIAKLIYEDEELITRESLIGTAKQ